MLTIATSRKAVFELVDELAVYSEMLGLEASEVERLIGVHGGVWPMSAGRRGLWWPSEEQVERIASLREVCASVIWLIGPEACAWMRKRNAGLGCSPIRFMLAGKDSVELLRDVLRMEQGQC